MARKRSVVKYSDESEEEESDDFVEESPSPSESGFSSEDFEEEPKRKAPPKKKQKVVTASPASSTKAKKSGTPAAKSKTTVGKVITNKPNTFSSSSSASNEKSSVPNTKVTSLSGEGPSGAAAGWKGPPVASEAAARKLILQYMLTQNRPFSVIQVYDNLHHRVSKTVAQHSLDSLCSGQGLASKDYGKARIYFPDQDLLQSDFKPSDLAQLDDDATNLEKNLQDLKQEEMHLRVSIKSLEAELPDDELDSAIEVQKSKAEELRQRLSSLDSKDQPSVTPQDFAKAAAEHKKYRNAWRDRKAKVRDLIDMMADGMEKSVKSVTELLGIETDEESGAVIPPALSTK